MRSTIAILLSLLLCVSALVALALDGSAGGEETDVWYQDVTHTLRDTDDDGKNDAISIAYDVDTDAANGTEVHVKLYVKDSEGRVIDDPVNEHFVANDTVEYWYQNWTAERADNYTFELKLFHDEQYVEKKTFHAYLHASGEDVEVWYQEVSYTLRDTDDDGRDDSISFAYDVDTDATNGTEVHVKLYVKDSEGHVIDDQVKEHFVANDTVEYWYQNWTAERTDNYTFELKLYHGELYVERRTYHIYLEAGDEGEGTLRIIIQNDYDSQYGDFYIDDVKEGRYNVTHGDNCLGEFTLPAGQHEVWFELANDASDGKGIYLEDGDSLNITLRPEKEESGWLKIWSNNDYDGQGGWLYINRDYIGEYEVPHGERLLGEFELGPGEYEVELILANNATDTALAEVREGETSHVELRPAHYNHGWLEIISVNEFDTQEGWLHIDDDLWEVYQVSHGEHWLGEFLIEAGEHEITLILDNDASATVELYITANTTTTVELVPHFTEDDMTINVEGSVRVMENCTELNDIHFYAHIRDEPVDDVLIKVYGEGRPGGPVRHGYTNDDGYWVDYNLDPGRYEWVAKLGEETLEQGEFVVYADLDRAARGDIYSVGQEEERHWNYFKALAYDGMGHGVEGVRVSLWQGEELVTEGETNDYGFYQVFQLPRGWYHYRTEWPTEHNGTLLLSASQVYSFGPPESAEPDPWFRGVEMEKYDADDDGKRDTVKIRWNADTAHDELVIWSLLKVWQGGHVVHDMAATAVIYGEDDDDWYTFEWSPAEAGEYAFELGIGPVDDEGTDWWEHAPVELYPVCFNCTTEPGVTISIEPLVRSAEPGTVATFTITVLNVGTEEATFELTAQVLYLNSSSDNWGLTLSQRVVTLAGGAFARLELAVAVPVNASTRDTLIFQIVAESGEVRGEAVASVLVIDGDSPGLPAPGLAVTVAVVGSVGVVASFRRRRGRLRH